MKTTPLQYAQALWELSQEKTDNLDPHKIMEEFVEMLRRRGDTKKLARILQKLEQLEDASTDTKHVSITTAFPVNAELTKELEAFAQKTFESRAVKVEMRTDSTLLGGVVMKTDNHLVDVSVAGKIRSLRKTLLV